MLYVEQIRAARALLGWNQMALAEESGIGISTIKRIETGSGLVRSSTNSAWKIQKALEKAGIVFIEGDGSTGPGVKLSKPISDNG